MTKSQEPAASPEQMLDALNWRYAVKQFDPARTIPEATWKALEASLVLSPSSFGLQPWHFVVITSPAIKAKLQPISWNQSQVRDASHVVVFAAKLDVTVADVDRFMARTIEVRRQTAETLAGYRKMMAGFVQNPPPGFEKFNWAARQAYIAMGFFMTAAAALGVDTCPMEGIDHAAYDELLGVRSIGDGYATLAAVAAGYRSGDDKYAQAAKVRYTPEELITRV